MAGELPGTAARRQVDFKQIFSKFAEYDFSGWTVYEGKTASNIELRPLRRAFTRLIIRVTDSVRRFRSDRRGSDSLSRILG